MKVEISENLRFLRTNTVSVVALPVFCDDYPIKTPPYDGGILKMRSARWLELALRTVFGSASSKGHSHPAKKYIGPVFMFGHLSGNRIPDVLIAWNEPDRRRDGEIVENFYSHFVVN